ncbi:probable LRR receptor-like serine/threonine-protein kinase At1g63430 isoform X2 [Cryptomeria japonica]|uniref:probable LRR receptor-like serine/threonine-protein kinase At1g63430 isoform X2 n=1 Tax=Cryptomeria japonica TaxID=3369 RepID=UPI0027DA6230|nr:probable LRR receptor-like serine/threonine-protein kinase At1g63430 isoform X2 [Cryptomeria japonica]
MMSPWDTSESPCAWFGAGKEKKVVSLESDSKQLKGSLSPAIGRLSELKKLSFANNLLVGRIPKEFASCLKLEVVDLSGNKLSGPIRSEFGNLRSLKTLWPATKSFSE